MQAAQAKVDQAQKELEETKQRVAAQYDKEQPTDWSPDQKARIRQIADAVTPQGGLVGKKGDTFPW